LTWQGNLLTILGTQQGWSQTGGHIASEIKL